LHYFVLVLMVWSSMLFVVFVSVVCGGGLFSAELRSFLESHDLARSHCGVSFDVVTGQHSSAALFLNASFRLDPFVAQSEVRAVEVPTLQALFREMALEQRVADFQPGMFVKSFLPHFAPEHEREASQVTFFARRTQAVLGIALDPASLSRLSPDLRIALERLPERFDPSETEVWRGFFSRFCTHWVDEAVVGGRLQVSGRLFDASVSPKEVRDALEEHLLLVSSSDGARERLAALSGKFVSRLNAEGGAELNIVSVDALSKAAFEHWSQKIEQHPAVVRYSLRHISELAGAPAKQKAVRDAADHFLAAKHAEWRKDHMERFHGASLEEEHREVRLLCKSCVILTRGENKTKAFERKGERNVWDAGRAAQKHSAAGGAAGTRPRVRRASCASQRRPRKLRGGAPRVSEERGGVRNAFLCAGRRDFAATSVRAGALVVPSAAPRAKERTRGAASGSRHGGAQSRRGAQKRAHRSAACRTGEMNIAKGKRNLTTRPNPKKKKKVC
jgi:hypothetical protein